MVRTLIAFMVIVFGTVSIVCAAPFLVCDPYPTTVTQPDWFNLKINGANPIQSPDQTLPDGSKRLHYDVGPMSPGNYRFEVSAVKDYGVEGTAESAATPFDYEKPVVAAPGKPVGIGLSPN